MLTAGTLLFATILSSPTVSGQTTPGDESASMAELREARRAASEDPRGGTPRLIRALGAIQAWGEAESLARTLYEEAPDAERALLLAWTLRRQERLTDAIDLLEKELDGASAAITDTIHRELALLLRAAGQPSRALEVTESSPSPDLGVKGLALAALPERDDDAANILLAALENADETVVPSADLVRELGTVLLERGDSDAALPHLRSTAGTFSEDPDAAYRLALALRAQGKTDEARNAMERFQLLRRTADRRDTERRTLGTKLNEAQELAQQNRLDEALSEVDAVIDGYPDSYSALALRAKIRFSLRQMDGALADIRRAARLEPSVTEFHYLEGLFERTAGQSQPARDALRRALALDPELVEAHALLGGIELDLGNPSAAITHLETAVSLGASGTQIERALEIARARAKASP